ncbi:Vegetative incompatibility protein HET-E-1 [Diplodia seriata]|uniref:Vegetative incompatibility protein HET-E-1 n=1 Tax=Diplodia seriata TaxID=420778 RepID=A0A1S8BMM6_9PEZI|nr:Vegetative incompatibility protein HET-E-1 [Diplodia seriata]
MEVAASVIAVIQISSNVATLCWHYRKLKSAPQEAAKIIQQLKSLDVILNSMVELLEDENAAVDPRFRTIEFLQKSGQLDAFQALLKDLEGKLKPPRGLEKLLFPLKSRDVEATLQEIEKFKTVISLALGVHQAACLNAMSVNVRDIKETQENAVEAQRHAQEARHMESILKWLAPPDSDTNHFRKREEHHKDTGIWFVEGVAIDHWKRGTPSLFWLHGIPGCGKSVLSSTLIECLKKEELHKADDVVAYFYFDFSDTKKRNASSLMRSLISQLVINHKRIWPRLEDIFEQHHGQRQPSSETLLLVLQELVTKFKRTFLVVDGLDESEDVEDTLNIVRSMCDWNISGLRIFVSSRPLGIIEEAFSEMHPLELSVSDHLVDPDIQLFLGSKVKDLSQWDLDTRAAISETLSERANGMFRLASGLLDLVGKCRKKKDLQVLLSSLPRTLEDMYERILLSIPEDERRDAFRTLEWLAFSDQPVRMEDLSEALAVELDDQHGYDPDLKDLCIHRSPIMNSSLVTTSKAWLNDVKSSPGYYDEIWDSMNIVVTEVRLAHASILDYLRSPGIRRGRAASFALDWDSANRTMAQTCLLYLLNPSLKSGYPTSMRGLNLLLREWPLLIYASHFWGYHTQELGEELDSTTWNLIQQLFESKKLPNCGNFGTWARFLTPGAQQQVFENTTPLYYASSLGIGSVVRKLLKTLPLTEVNALGGRNASTPLQAAAYRDHLDVVRLLLDAGADPNIRTSRSDGSALFWAILRNGPNGPRIANLLLQHGASLCREDREELDKYGVSSIMP